MDPASIGAAMTALGWGAYAPVVLAVSGLAAAIAAVAPRATDVSPTWWRVTRGALDILGGNFANARNAPLPPGK